jgi:hypothetical protein
VIFSVIFSLAPCLLILPQYPIKPRVNPRSGFCGRAALFGSLETTGLILSRTIGLSMAGAVPLLMAVLPQGKPHHLTREDLANEIEAFLNGTGGVFDWDEFCTFTIADPELDKIRERCARLDKEFPPSGSGGYCNEEGIKVLRDYIEVLRRLGA